MEAQPRIPPRNKFSKLLFLSRKRIAGAMPSAMGKFTSCLDAGCYGIGPNAIPFDRFKRFAHVIAAVPKSEVENENKKLGSARSGARLKKRKVKPNGNDQDR